jgi:hypothetical protein
MYPGGGYGRPGGYPGGPGMYPGMYPGGRPGAAPRRGYAPNDTRRPHQLASGMAPGGGYPGMYPGGYPGGYGGYGRPGGYPGMYPGMYPGAYPGMQPGAGMGSQAVPGGFNVTSTDQAITVWAHDDSVKDGKTYRYAIKYRIRNPLFTTNIGATKDMNEQFALQSPLSNWSDPVKITPKINFFVLNTQGTELARFEMFIAQNARTVRSQVKVTPGDLIPNTTWTSWTSARTATTPTCC